MDVFKKIENKFPQYLHFECGMTHLNYSLKTVGITFELQNELLETRMNHVEVNGNEYKDKKHECLEKFQ